LQGTARDAGGILIGWFMWGHTVDKLLNLVWGHHCPSCPSRMVRFGYRRKSVWV